MKADTEGILLIIQFLILNINEYKMMFTRFWLFFKQNGIFRCRNVPLYKKEQ